MPANDTELTRRIEGRLQKRLEELVDELDRRQTEIELDMSQGRTTSSLIARGQLIAAWLTAFQSHGELVLADVGNLLTESAENKAPLRWLEQRFASHVDHTAQRILGRLTERRQFGVSPSAAERRRLTNVSVGIKSRAGHELETAVARRQVATRLRADHDKEQASEWDDRLPLRRRRAFDRDLCENAAAAGATKDPLSLVMLDLDFFKSVNDRYGHMVGDEVLFDVSRIVTQRVARKGRVYRYGGEEISILLPAYSSDEAVGLAERLRKDIAQTVVSHESLHVTASLGVACLPDDALTPDSLLERADRALYRAKESGRNCVRAADDAADARQPHGSAVTERVNQEEPR